MVQPVSPEATLVPSLSFLIEAIALVNEKAIKGMVMKVPILSKYVEAWEKAIAANS